MKKQKKGIKRLFLIILTLIISIILTGKANATNGLQSANVQITSLPQYSFKSTSESVNLHYIIYDAYNDSEYNNQPITSATFIEIYRWNGSSWTEKYSIALGAVENGSYAAMGCENVNNIPGCTNLDLTKVPLTSGTTNTIKEKGTYKINVVAKPWNTYTNSFVSTSTIPESRYAMKTVYVNVYAAGSSYNISYTKSSETKYVGDVYTPSMSYNTNGHAITYTSSNTSVATVDSTGKVTAKGVGTATITAKLTYSPSNITTTYKVTVQKGDPYATFESSSITKKLTDGTFINKLTYSGDGKVTYTSSNTSVATVSSTGVVTIKGVGTTTIKASISSTNNWLDDQASYTLTVKSSLSDGFHKNSNGVYEYYKDGVIYTSFNAIAKVPENGVTYYFKNGVANISFTGIVNYLNTKYYVEKGIVTYNYNGTFKSSLGNIYVIKNSIVDTKATGLYKADGTWYYFNSGSIDYTYTGVATNEKGTWYVKKGIVDFKTNEVIYYNNAWQAFVKSKLTPTYTGILSNSKGTWYVEKGKVTFKYTGFYKDSNGDVYSLNKSKVTNINGLQKAYDKWYYFKNGKTDLTYTGVAKNEKGTWYVKKGIVDFKTNELVYYNNAWRAFVKSKLTPTYTGILSNKKGNWYVKNGAVQFNFNGTYKDSTGNIYMIKSGKVDTTQTTVEKVDGTWYYFKNGKTDFKYTGLAKNKNGTWYVEKGKVTFKYNGAYKDPSTGKTYKIKNSKVV